MSLLEDVFLEDEAGEAQELERIIDGDEYDERPRALSPDSDDNSEKEDEAEEDKRRVDPTTAKQKRVVKNPRVVLNPARLMGPRGIQVIPEHFKDFKYKGKGHETEDLDLVLKKLEHWAYRLYPKFQFEDCLKKIETLGKKRPVLVHLTKIRSDQYISEETVVQRDSSDEEAAQPAAEEDEFDKLLQQQIDIARATPTSTIRKQGFTPMVDRSSMPKATSSPSINDEQRERMLKNREMAEERRLARLKQNNLETRAQNINEASQSKTNDSNKSLDANSSFPLNTAVQSENIMNEIDNIPQVNNNRSNDSSDEEAPLIINENTNSNEQRDNDTTNLIDENIQKKRRSNVIDSSDEDEVLIVNKSITVDVHYSRRNVNDYENHSDTNNRNINTINDDIAEIRTESHDVDMDDIDAVENTAKAFSQKDIEQTSKTRTSDETVIESDRYIEEDLSKMTKVSSQDDKESSNDERLEKPITEREINIEGICEIAKACSQKDDKQANTETLDKSVTESDKNIEDLVEVNSKAECKPDHSEQSNEDAEKRKNDEQNETEKTEINRKEDQKENELEDIMEVDFSDDF